MSHFDAPAAESFASCLPCNATPPTFAHPWDPISWEDSLGQESPAQANTPTNFSIRSFSHGSFRDDYNGEQDGVSTNGEDRVVPLEKWIEGEMRKERELNLRQSSVIRKVTVAYGIGKILHHILSLKNSSFDIESLCAVNNFTVRVSDVDISGRNYTISGVGMICPTVLIRITTNSFSSSRFFGPCDGSEKCDVVVELVESPYISVQSETDENVLFHSDETDLCHQLGVLLEYVFSGPSKLDSKRQLHDGAENVNDETNAGNESDTRIGQPSCLKKKSLDLIPSSNSLNPDEMLSPTFLEYGYPPAISHVVGDLLACGDGNFCHEHSYSSLESAVDDLYLLLHWPNRFLFWHPNRQIRNPRSIVMSTDKVYGRSSESSVIVEAFCRVASTRESEAVFIRGFSGCGKTALVHSVYDVVQTAAGLIAECKFEESSSQSPLTSLLSTFNMLCLQIAERSTTNERQMIYQGLINEFGTNFGVLTSVIPAVHVMNSRSATVLPSLGEDIVHEVNYFSLCTVVQKFMRLISRYLQPVMLFLDDLQWADPISLGLVHAVLSDSKKSSSVLFVGSYRDSLVHPDHIIFGFINQLSIFEVPMQEIKLEGLNIVDITSMLSDIFGVLPNRCQSLSCIILRKTSGNPFFALEFLCSLIDRDLVRFDLRRKCWDWDSDKIRLEKITDNVLHLVSAKISALPNDMQDALKIASCFGIKINESIVRYLSTSSRYRSLSSMLKQAAADGFMDFDGSMYHFVHDNIRDAVYALIGPADRDELHFTVGMSLYWACLDHKDEDTDLLFATVGQINHGDPNHFLQSQRIAIVELNYEAGLKSLLCSNYASAHTYARTSVSLLSDISWESHYELTLKCYFQLAKAAFSSGSVEEASNALNIIVEHGKRREDKIESYFLLISILLLTSKLLEAVDTSLHVLSLLGEHLPKDGIMLKEDVIENQLCKVKRMLDNESDETLLNMRGQDCNQNLVVIMRAYHFLSLSSSMVDLKMCLFYVAKWVEFCLHSKVSSKYTPIAFTSFAAVMITNGMDIGNSTGNRIGRLGLQLFHQEYHSALDVLPFVSLHYYSNSGVLHEPIQACVQMHRHAYDIGMQIGNPMIASFHMIFIIARSLHAGVNLFELEKEIKIHCKLAKHHSQPLLGMKLDLYHRAVLSLIGDETSESYTQKNIGDFDNIHEGVETYCMSNMIVSLFLRYHERTRYMIQKWSELSEQTKSQPFPLRSIYTSFYSGLATTGVIRKKANNPKDMAHVSKSLSMLENAARLSTWNFQNKACLVKAEKYSILGVNDEARNEYNASIEAARSSKFIHEEALACELAGLHYKQLGDNEEALNFFTQSKGCYEKWGSKMKASQMEIEIDAIRELAGTMRNENSAES